MIGKCCSCGKIRWIFKNKNDTGYNQKACWKCYKQSAIYAKEYFNKNNKINLDFHPKENNLQY